MKSLVIVLVYLIFKILDKKKDQRDLADITGLRSSVNTVKFLELELEAM